MMAHKITTKRAVPMLFCWASAQQPFGLTSVLSPRPLFSRISQVLPHLQYMTLTPTEFMAIISRRNLNYSPWHGVLSISWLRMDHSAPQRNIHNSSLHQSAHAWSPVFESSGSRTLKWYVGIENGLLLWERFACTGSGMLHSARNISVAERRGVGSISAAKRQEKISFDEELSDKKLTDLKITQSKPDASGRGSVEKPGRKGPNMDELNKIKTFMLDQIPMIMSKQHEYRVYTKDLIFENNWDTQKPYKTVGVARYVLKVVKARFYIHANYAKVRVVIISAHVDESNYTVTVQWRIEGLPQLKAIMFWKYVPFMFKKKGREESEWLDGLSTFHVNERGFIYKHRLDRMMVDKDQARLMTDVDKANLELQQT